jgi:hypothetical protein
MKGFVSIEILLLGLMLIGLFGALTPATNRMMNGLSENGRNLIEARELIGTIERTIELASVHGYAQGAIIVPVDGNIGWGNEEVEYNYVEDGNLITVRGKLPGYNITPDRNAVKAGNAVVEANLINGSIVLEVKG